MKKIYKDGHIHSPFCPHGTDDTFESYVEMALKKGLKEISFTEHLPIPAYFMDDKIFMDDCAPSKDEMYKYFEELKIVKEKYKDKIKINSGCEAGFVEGYEEKTKELLNEYGQYLEDSILSVHFIKLDENEYTDIDGLDGFERALKKLGSVSKVYDKYYETVIKAVKSDLGEFKPKRIGHPNLIRIFNKLYPIEYKNDKLIRELAHEIKLRDYEVDVNTAGYRKPHCGEIYVQGLFARLVDELNIKKVYGSDSHESKDVARDFNREE